MKTIKTVEYLVQYGNVSAGVETLKSARHYKKTVETHPQWGGFKVKIIEVTVIRSTREVK